MKKLKESALMLGVSFLFITFCGGAAAFAVAGAIYHWAWFVGVPIWLCLVGWFALKSKTW